MSKRLIRSIKMIECLSEIGIDDKDLQIISKLYWEQSACVRTESGMTSEFKINKGVRQGCVLSPNLFVISALLNTACEHRSSASFFD